MKLSNQKILASVLTSIASLMVVYLVKGSNKEKAMAGIAMFLLGIYLSVIVIKSEPEVA